MYLNMEKLLKKIIIIMYYYLIILMFILKDYIKINHYLNMYIHSSINLQNIF